MNTIAKNHYIYQDSIRDYQKVKECIAQGLSISVGGNSQHNKTAKEDYISEKLVTNLNGGIGRMISSESVVPTFGWGNGFFSNWTPRGTGKIDKK